MPGSSCLGVKFTTGALDQALSVGAFQRIPFEALSVDVFDESLRLDVCLAHNTTHFPRGSMCGRMRRGGLIHFFGLGLGFYRIKCFTIAIVSSKLYTWPSP